MLYCGCRDHPRRCGENERIDAMLKPCPGSPPQVRGKLPAADGENSITGITPAGAGKTTFQCAALTRFKDHPRRCGENPNSRIVRAQQSGSPPQVRGKHYTDWCTDKGERITPAGAGKTPQSSNFILFFRDHPRRCGENKTTLNERFVNHGSPPQVRGKRFGLLALFHGYGITPAGAGKTGFVPLLGGVAGDHPRRCGENFVDKEQALVVGQDHPRRCGENTKKIL